MTPKELTIVKMYFTFIGHKIKEGQVDAVNQLSDIIVSEIEENQIGAKLGDPERAFRFTS